MKPNSFEEKTVDTKRIYDGKILNLRVDKVLLPNGRESTREVVEHGGAACILPVGADGAVYLVRQFRYPFNREVLEAPAGKLEPGEIVSDAANRELEEETGFRAQELVYLGEFLPSVAYLTEIIHLYLARGLTEEKQHLDEDEFLNIESYPFDRVVEMIARGDISDGKTIAAVFKAKLYLENEGKEAAGR